MARGAAYEGSNRDAQSSKLGHAAGAVLGLDRGRCVHGPALDTSSLTRAIAHVKNGPFGEQVSQTDYREDGTVFGSVLNHVTDGRWATGKRHSASHEATLQTRATPSQRSS